MKAKNTLKESRTDWNRLKSMKDSEIDVSDIPKLDASFFKRAKLRMPRPKQAVSQRQCISISIAIPISISMYDPNRAS